MSDDHGETFQQWIRWDSLVSVLHNTEHPDGNRLSILEIKPQDSSGRRVLLTLDIGQGLSAKVVTDDQGMSWRAL